MTEFSNLIETKLIDAARATLAEAADRLTAAQAAVAEARANHTAAKRAADAAISSAAADALDLSEAEEAAARRLAVVSRVLDAATEARRKATDGLNEATGVAHRPVYVRGAQMRLQAARKADAARAMLTEAEADHRAGTAALKAAIAAGAGDVTFGRFDNEQLPLDEQSEMKIWTDGYHRNWWQPVFVTEG